MFAAERVARGTSVYKRAANVQTNTQLRNIERHVSARAAAESSGFTQRVSGNGMARTIGLWSNTDPRNRALR
ncbi:hypothetical protein [Paraburkholderia terrae]